MRTARWRNGVDAGAVHRSLSWFNSRPGLHQPSLLRSLASASRRMPSRRSSKSEGGALTPQANRQNSRLMGPLKPFRSCKIWSKDASRAYGYAALFVMGTRGMRALFLCLDFAANRDRHPLPSGERVGVRGSPGDVELLNKRLKNTVDVSQNVMIPEPDDMIAGVFQDFGPHRIRGGSLRVLPPVDLDDEVQIKRHKIHDVARDRLLPFELDTVEPPATQLAPYQLLGFGHPPSQRPCMLAHREAPSPNPLPNGERALEPFPVANICPIHY